MSRTATPLIVLITGFSFSLAANILWCWPGGPVRILGGALASVALPAAIHMHPHVVTSGWPSRLLRDLVMVCIASLAAVTTFAHAASLLIAHGEDVRLAAGYPAITELLVVFAVLARRAPVARRSATARPSRAGTKQTKQTKQPARVATPRPVAIPTIEGLEGRRSGRHDMVAWLAAQPPRCFSDEVDAVRAEFGCSFSTAKRVRAETRRKASA